MTLCKYIEISTNMPVIGSLIRKKTLKCEKANTILLSKINARVVLVVRVYRQINTFKIIEFHDHIWNNHEKCIPMSTNIPGIGPLIREIAIKNVTHLGNQTTCCFSKTSAHVLMPVAYLWSSVASDLH